MPRPGRSVLSSCAARRPSSENEGGIRMSMMTTSGWSAATRTMASFGEAAKSRPSPRPGRAAPPGPHGTTASRPRRSRARDPCLDPYPFLRRRGPLLSGAGAHLPANGVYPVPDGGQPRGPGSPSPSLPSLRSTADSRSSAAYRHGRVARRAVPGQPVEQLAHRQVQHDLVSSASRPALTVRRRRAVPHRRATRGPPGRPIRAAAGTSPARGRAACRWRPGAARSPRR